MRVIIDTNIMISALMKDSLTRKIILESGWEFFYPAISLMEIRKHERLIIEKSGLSEDECAGTLMELLRYVSMVPYRDIEPEMGKAREALGNVDEDDVVFLATALSIADSIIWSNDKHFKMQNIINCFSTREIVGFGWI